MKDPKGKLKDTEFIDHTSRNNRDYSLGESDAEERIENVDSVDENENLVSED